MADLSYVNNGYNEFLSRKPVVHFDTEDKTAILKPQITGTNIFSNIEGANISEKINDIIRYTNTSTTQSLLPNGSNTSITSTLKYTYFPERPMFAICMITVYMDSISTSTIVPYGSTTIAGTHRYTAWYDYAKTQNTDLPNSHLTFTFNLYNETGSNHVYIYRLAWAYFGMEDVKK